TGLTLMLVPLVWSFFDLPSLSQMAITIAAVMAVPSFTGDIQLDSRVVIQRAVQRMMGCFLGGLAALAVLLISIQQLLPWLATIAAWIWICGHIQGSRRGVGYVGTQAAIVFILTLVQGFRPPESILPGIERLAGMAGGLTILLLV